MSILFSTLAVVVGAGFGGALRAAMSRYRYGTLAANTVACGVFGALVGAGVSGAAQLFLIVGFAGALSTWSTLAKELGMLVKQSIWRACRYFFVTLVLGCVSFVICQHLATAFL